MGHSSGAKPKDMDGSLISIPLNCEFACLENKLRIFPKLFWSWDDA